MAASPPPTLLATAVAEALRHSRPRAFEHAAAAAAAAAAALHVMMAAGMVHRASSPPGLDAVSAATPLRLRCTVRCLGAAGAPARRLYLRASVQRRQLTTLAGPRRHQLLLCPDAGREAAI